MTFIERNSLNKNKIKKSYCILDLSQPLFKNSPIKNFFYLSLDKNYTYTFISPDYKKIKDNRKFVQHIYDENSEIIKNFKQNSLLSSYKYISKINFKNYIQIDENQFELNYYFNILKKKKDGNIEIFIFLAGLKSHDIVNYYLNHSDILERFSFYFSNEINNLNLKIKTDQLVDSSINDLCFHIYQKPCDTYSLIDFAEQTHVKRYVICYSNGQKCVIPKRQIQCLYYLTQGKTSKEIARILNISFRTVEAHLQTLKIKLNSFSKSDIMKYLDADIKNFIETGIKYKKSV